MIGLSSTKSALKYATMPQILPRVKTLFFGGFGYIPYFIAAVYQMVGLLPRNHPYLDPNNIGRFGIRHVVAQAASNIKLSWRNIDQIVLFCAVIAGLVIFIVQFFAMASVIFMQPAAALPVSWTGYFTITNFGYRNQDLAYMMLDMVFGVPDPAGGGGSFFGSCVGGTAICQDSTANNLTPMQIALFASFTATEAAQLSPLSPGAPFPWPFHDGLHRMFAIYSTALLVIAVMIASYFVVTIIGETAQTGTPFGRRFNKTWAPIRIVVAFGLLVPMTIGLNSSQYIVLYAAKYGSAFASNGWRYFNDTLTTSYLGSGQRMVSTPNIPELTELTQFMYVARTCRYVYNYYELNRKRLQEAASGAPTSTALAAAEQVQAYVLLEATKTPPRRIINTGTTYASVRSDFTDQARTVRIRFGIADEDRFKTDQSNVKAICGEINLPFTNGTDYGVMEVYIRNIQMAYFNLVRDMWHDDFWNGLNGGGGYPAYSASNNHRHKYLANKMVNGIVGADKEDPNHPVALNAEFVQNANDRAQNNIQTTVVAATNLAALSTLWGGPYGGTAAIADPLYSRGWASAGIWYNRIAELNGHLSAAAFAGPEVSTWPAIMEQVSDIKLKYDSTLTASERFKPSAAGIDDINLLLDQSVGLEFSTVLYEAMQEWEKASGVESQNGGSNNPITSILKYFFGLTGLYNMRDNSDPANNTHPLARLSGVGKSLVEGSIRSLSYAGLATITGALGVTPSIAQIVANFLITFAMLGLTVGFILFYIVPFLPFIYFFFAVGGWVKGIFEAMVGAPLWALAHIRIDGNGLPGNAALNGYFLIFEVFLRPILIVFGMLASISTYSALVSVLNNIFSIVVENTAGYDVQSEIAAPRDTLNYMRAEIDEFFFTVIYTIIVYMLGMSSFKLVDTMPNNILRWMGQSVATFGDQREDPAQNLVSRASIGSQQALANIGRGLQATSQAAIKAGE